MYLDSILISLVRRAFITKWEACHRQTAFTKYIGDALLPFFATSVRNNPDASHLLFTNTRVLPVVDGVDFGSFLANLDVKVINLDLTYQPPSGFYGAWRNQFYIFDILKYLNEVVSDSDSCIVLDSDCVWVGPVTQMANAIQQHGALTLDIKYPSEQCINGLNRKQMKTIFEEMGARSISDIPRYFGGEFFGATGAQIRVICNEVDSVWEITMDRFRNNLPKFNEEAHMLSYIYDHLGYAPGTANPYIKRIWTGLHKNNNVSRRGC